MTPRARQRGAALLLLAAMLVMGITWMIVTAIGNAAQRTASDRDRNARALAEAKAALIAWMATNALDSSEDNPGKLPCPQAWADVGTNLEGRAASTCSAPAAGWLPWRTLGLPQMYDAYGNQLWYVVSPGWHLPNTLTKLDINSNTTGALTLDGQTVVALVIAPGPALNIVPTISQTAAGCTARSQSRSLNPPTALNPLDFLDCHNGTTSDYTFTSAVVGNASNTVFNDQVVALTAADILPALEGAIAKRIERDIAPALKSVYASGTFGIAGIGKPVYPYAATFADPTASTYKGSAAVTAGLLPFFQTQGCTPATDPRCTTATTGGSAFLVFSKSGNDTYASSVLPPIGSIRTQSSCSWSGSTYTCTGEYLLAPIKVTLTLRVTNIAMGLRTFDSSKISCTAVDDSGGGIPLQNIGCSATSVALQSDGSALVTVTTNWTPDIVTSGWGTYANYIISFDRAVFGDHSLLDSTSTGTGSTGWFVRNEWYRLLYYAVASGHTAAALPGAPACTDSSTCLVARSPVSSLTALSGGIAATGTTLVVSSSAGAPAPSFRIQVDTEVMQVTAVSGTTWTVVRGTDGSSAAAHNDLSSVKLVGRDRAILILAGRSINGSSRPSNQIADYLEYGNRTGKYERLTITRTTDTGYADTGVANAYAISATTVSTGQTIRFKALNANTGAATLTSPATGTKSILNSDLSVLSASQIQTNAVIEVDYDGTQFKMTKRPFNDRFVVVDANP